MKKLNPIVKQRIQLYGGVLLLLLICAGVVNAYRITNTNKRGQMLEGTGDEVRITRPFTVENIQGDNYDVPMGDSAFSLREQGSLLPCMAAALQVNGQDIQVLALNELLLKENIYKDGAVIDWDRLEKSAAFWVTKVKAPPTFTSKKVFSYLAEGYLPLAKVHVKEKERWIVITGEDRLHGFTVKDPLEAQEEERYLSEYGSVYALRVLCR